MNPLVLRPIYEEERETAANLVASVFGNGDVAQYNLIYHYFNTLRPQLPGTPLAQEWGAFADRKMVAFMTVDPYALRYGRAVLRVSGIGSVCTHPEHRRRGYAAALMREVLAYATEEGSHLALLDGIPNYYDRFGFMSVWPGYRFTVSAADAAALPQLLQIRPADVKDIIEISQLYEQQWNGRVAFLRNRERWYWNLTAFPQRTFVAEQPDGRLAGYINVRELSMRGRVEVVAASRQAVQTLLSFGGKHWQEAGYERMTWAIPPDDILIPHAQQILPMTLSVQYQPNGGWMARLLDTGSLLRVLLPEITAQIRSTQPDFTPEQLILRVESDGVDLGLKHIPDAHCRLSLRDFIQVLFGSLTPATLGIRQGLSHTQIHLLESLFPPRMATLGAWDWF
ncbi:MAG: GNAT family N-acetyltransferase [Anaerolineae bacterium]|nr:GNAT family N-acetyltransferase [Anaerolineae bacterium]